MRNDTSVGKILLNVFLTSSTPVSRSGKNNVILVSVPNPPLYSKPSEGDNSLPATYLIRVKTADDADKLHRELVSKKEASSWIIAFVLNVSSIFARLQAVPFFS